MWLYKQYEVISLKCSQQLKRPELCSLTSPTRLAFVVQLSDVELIEKLLCSPAVESTSADLINAHW